MRDAGGARDQMPNSEGYSSVSRVLIDQRVEFRFAEPRQPVSQVSEEGVSPDVRRRMRLQLGYRFLWKCGVVEGGHRDVGINGRSEDSLPYFFVANGGSCEQLEEDSGVF